MAYTTVLFDFDHTLLDSDASEVAAYRQTLSNQGVANPARYFARYKQINAGLWAAVERGELLPGDVRSRRFELFVAELGLAADPHVMADDFAAGLGGHGDLYPGARQVLEQMAVLATLAMITNGLSEVQRARIERLDLEAYFDTVVISAEVGCTKPGREIFDITFEQLDHPARETVLMVGDSLSSDIRGGANYGLATCWYNPDGKTSGPDDQVTHEIASLGELLGLLPPS